MIVSVILCVLMSIVILFFVIANNGFSAVSIFYGLFLMFIYGGMTFSENKKKGSGTIYRRIFLTTYAVFFCIGFIANLFAERGSMAITNEALATCVLPILTKRRTQCSMLCPFGAFASLTDRLSPFKMRIDTEKCKGCMKCAQACLFGAIDVATIQQKKDSPEITCAKCGECIAACPEKAISYQFRFNKGCCAPVPKTKLAKGIQKFFAPENLFRFAAFTFGVIMSSAFAINSIELILKFFAH